MDNAIPPSDDTVFPLVAMSDSDLESVSHVLHDITLQVGQLKVLMANIGVGDTYFYVSSEVVPSRGFLSDFTMHMPSFTLTGSPLVITAAR